MDVKGRPLIPINCLFQGCYNPAYEAEIEKCKDTCWKYIMLSPNDREGRQAILRDLLGHMGEGAEFVPPFWCDYGYRISVGNNFYANHNTVMQDGAGITFGDNVFIAPNCTFSTAEHPTDPEQRKKGLEIAKPIKIGNNVWIGSNATVLAGVTIGDDTVIGAGSVVTRDVPSGVVAVGVPCRVVREITEADKYRYPMFEPDTYGKQ